MTDSSDMVLAEEVLMGGVMMKTAHLPPFLKLHEDMGVVAHAAVRGQVAHRTPRPEVPLFEVRATKTPRGDYLLMFPEGGHYGGSDKKTNTMLAYRSQDSGRTWSGPTVAFDIDYNQHGFIPLIPRGSTRIYAFGTQPVWGMYTRERGLAENAPIGYRYSNDDGHTWSEVRIIRPVNDPDFRGMSVMRMCETDSGVWLLGAHEGDWTYKPLVTCQYILRSEDQGQSWTVLPHPRHGGWRCMAYGRMDEGRPLNLGGGRVLFIARTPEGHLWQLRSEDDGQTWTAPQPTALIHPDAPPMICQLDDGTIVALHHNRHTGGHFNHGDRSEVWVSISRDEGSTWSEPRFVFANALAETLENPFRNHQCSYIDVWPDESRLHMFVPHRWRQVLHLALPIADLERLPTKAELWSRTDGRE